MLDHIKGKCDHIKETLAYQWFRSNDICVRHFDTRGQFDGRGDVSLMLIEPDEMPHQEVQDRFS